MVTVRNKSNDVESTFTDKEWDAIKDSPRWTRTFTVIEPKRKPAEVQDKEESKSSQKAEKNGGK